MEDLKIPIPEKFKSQLRHVEPKDKRSDAEILEALTHHVPVTSEKNVWTYWHAGVEAMPKWCQRNIIHWVRLHPEWTVRVLDRIADSPNYALKWISADELPKVFLEGTMTGRHVGAHSADFLRGAALYHYGGCWIDVGCMLFRTIDRICWNKLEDESSPYRIATAWMFEQYMFNHFVAARKGDPFIKKWHELFIHLWKDRTDFRGISSDPLIVAFMANFNFAKCYDRGLNMDFAVPPDYAMDYVGQVLAWIRLAWLQEPNGGLDGVEYWAKKTLLFDGLSEDLKAEQIVGYPGENLFSVLTTRRDADPTSEKYKAAEDCAWRILAGSSMQKLMHGNGIAKTLQCGTLLDMEEDGAKDNIPGTFGELLRYGSLYYEQTRDTIDYLPDPPTVPEELIIHKGFLEP